MNAGPIVGVAGAETEPVEAAVRAAGAEPVVGAAASVADAGDYVVAVGEPALLAVARAEPSAPVLPIDAGRGVRSVRRADAEDAIRSLLDGPLRTERHPQLVATVGDRSRVTVLTDLMLVTAEPAAISEYSIEADGEPVDQIRADGVVVATPAGSSGYARANDAPVVPPETDVAVISPVAPFRTDADHWAVPLGDVELTVERDETDVQLVADDRIVGPVEPHEPVRIRPDGAVEVAVVPASRSCFERE